MSRIRRLAVRVVVAALVMQSLVAQAQQMSPQPAFEAACADELGQDQAGANMGLPDGGYRRNYWRGQYTLWILMDTERLERWARQKVDSSGEAVEACGARFVLGTRGISVTPRGSVAEASGGASNGGPLGLRNKPAPARTGARSAAVERYWLKGTYVESFDCGDFCPAGRGVKVVVDANDAHGSRTSGARYPGTFGFGPPMEAGTTWSVRVDDQPGDDFYQCRVSGMRSGIVQPSAEAVNEGSAPSVTRVTCDLTDAGRAEVARLRADKNASDELLNRQ